MSGRQFVQVMARLSGYSGAEARRRTEETLELVGMADRADRKIAGYSKGMRQRVKLAQALLHDPRLLVLDEPLSGIDPVGRWESLELFRQLAERGKCLLISSHELEELEKLTDRVAIMARGRIAAIGTVSEIRDRLDNQPLTLRIDLEPPAADKGQTNGERRRELAAALLRLPDVIGVELAETDESYGRGHRLLVRAPQSAAILPRSQPAGARGVVRGAPHGDAGRFDPRGAGVSVGWDVNRSVRRV